MQTFKQFRILAEGPARVRWRSVRSNIGAILAMAMMGRKRLPEVGAAQQSAHPLQRRA
eukprot:SAG11_NODE_6844_length_1237_cov_1.316344_2_plen_57_part_01